MTRRSFDVDGMACGGCEQNVSDALSQLDGIESVDADHETDSVSVAADAEVTDDDISAAIEDAGYEVLG